MNERLFFSKTKEQIRRLRKLYEWNSDGIMITQLHSRRKSQSQNKTKSKQNPFGSETHHDPLVIWGESFNKIKQLKN